LSHCYKDGDGPDADLIRMLEKDVIDLKPNVTFDDIAELNDAKTALKEAILLPMMMPQVFVVP
jgi:katanin p60 ATPase-containing subunit A1